MGPGARASLGQTLLRGKGAGRRGPPLKRWGEEEKGGKVEIDRKRWASQGQGSEDEEEEDNEDDDENEEEEEEEGIGGGGRDGGEALGGSEHESGRASGRTCLAPRFLDPGLDPGFLDPGFWTQDFWTQGFGPYIFGPSICGPKICGPKIFGPRIFGTMTFGLRILDLVFVDAGFLDPRFLDPGLLEPRLASARLRSRAPANKSRAGRCRATRPPPCHAAGELVNRRRGARLPQQLIYVCSLPPSPPLLPLFPSPTLCYSSTSSHLQSPPHLLRAATLRKTHSLPALRISRKQA